MQNLHLVQGCKIL